MKPHTIHLGSKKTSNPQEIFWKKSLCNKKCQDVYLEQHLWTLAHLDLKVKTQNIELEMGLDLTWAYFSPTVNKRPTSLWPDQKRFFWPEGIKIEIFEVLMGNFPNTNHKWLTQPHPSDKKLTWPRSKIFDQDPSLYWTNERA